MKYYPEGTNSSLVKRFASLRELKEAADGGAVYEAPVLMCDSAHNLILDLGCCRGVIPRTEGALGILEGTVRDIALISKVNRCVCYQVKGFHRNGRGTLTPVLSRRSVQLACKKEYISALAVGDIIPAVVTRTEPFGAFIDIGAGINALIPIDMLSVSRINHPRERVSQGQQIQTVLRKREPEKLTFSLKELLGTWEENAAGLTVGDTVTGIVRSVEDYGVFVELAPNLAGLAEPYDGVSPGERVSVFIKSVLPDRMKIKLVIIDSFGQEEAVPPLTWFVSEKHLDCWEYSPPDAAKYIATLF